MWYVGRIPSSENPANPGFFELLCIDRKTGGVGWTAELSKAVSFPSRQATATRISSLPPEMQLGARPVSFRNEGPFRCA